MKRAYINGIILDGSENMQPQKQKENRNLRNIYRH